MYVRRGAFYLDKEEEVFKQDFSGATLDDHFDKTVLPKVSHVAVVYLIHMSLSTIRLLSFDTKVKVVLPV